MSADREPTPKDIEKTKTLLSSLYALFMGCAMQSRAMLGGGPRGGHRKIRSSRVPCRVARQPAMCPSCRKPLRRRLAGGLGRTDRFFDKQMGCMVCTSCAPAGGRA